MKLRVVIDKLLRFFSLRVRGTRAVLEQMNQLQDQINDLSTAIRDVQIRTQDVQNRAYDAIVQSRNESYEISNALKVNRLREKVKTGEKIRVVFLNSFIEKFEVASVYWEMEKSEHFEPIVFVMHEADFQFSSRPDFKVQAEENFYVFLKRGYRTQFAYNNDGSVVSLWELQPDIVFYNNPQLMHRTEYPNYYISANWLSCYTPYYMPVIKNDAYDYFNPNVTIAWKVFCPTRGNYREYITRQHFSKTHLYTFNGYNAVFTGYPKLDSYANPVDVKMLPEGICNGNPIVIIAPHGNIRFDINFATFHLYYQNYLDLLKKYPDINFVLKPHPMLRRRLAGMVIQKEDPPMTPEEFDQYLDEWYSHENGFYVSDGEYIDLFKASSLLITDSGSFISEYLPSGHPCIYLLNPENSSQMDKFNESAKRILRTYYCCKDWETAEKNFVAIMLDGYDPKRSERLAICQSELNQIGGSGKRIVDHIEQCLLQ